MEKVKNHVFREDIYNYIVLQKDSEITLKEKYEIKRILWYEINTSNCQNFANN